MNFLFLKQSHTLFLYRNRNIYNNRYLYTSIQNAIDNFSEEFSRKKDITIDLKNRSVFEFSGFDTFKFVQGLITGSLEVLDGVKSIDNKSNRNITSLWTEGGMRYCGFLNTKGKLIADSFIYKNINNEESENKLYIEIDSNVADQLEKHFRKFKFRKKVNIKHLDVSVQARITNNNISEKEWWEDIRFNSNISTFDFIKPKVYRKITLQNNNNKANLDNLESIYDLYRILSCVPEGVKDFDIEKTIIPEANFLKLGGLEENIGCYLGQELISRVMHTGVIRRTVSQVLIPKEEFENNPNEFKSGMKLTDIKGKRLGRLGGLSDNIGLAFIPLENIDIYANNKKIIR